MIRSYTIYIAETIFFASLHSNEYGYRNARRALGHAKKLASAHRKVTAQPKTRVWLHAVHP